MGVAEGFAPPPPHFKSDKTTSQKEKRLVSSKIPLCFIFCVAYFPKTTLFASLGFSRFCVFELHLWLCQETNNQKELVCWSKLGLQHNTNCLTTCVFQKCQKLSFSFCPFWRLSLLIFENHTLWILLTLLKDNVICSNFSNLANWTKFNRYEMDQVWAI